MLKLKSIALTFFLLVVAGLAATANVPKEHYVSPSGVPSGDGTKERPWDLVTALAHPAAVRPGDTIWVRGGMYPKRHPDMWQPKLTGTPAAPIVVRAVPGERVQVTGPWRIFGADCWYWGLEHTYTGTESRVSAEAGSGPTDQPVRGWVAIYGDRVKVINPVIHDLNEGINFFGGGSLDSEVYGAIIYNVGWQGTDRGNGNGAYIQSAAGTKWITDCIAFNTFATGMKGYGTAAAVKGLVFDGLMIFNAGAYAVDTPSQGGPSQNLLVTSEREPVDGIVVQTSAFYHSAWNPGANVRLGHGSTPALGCKVLNNYMAGGSGLSVSLYDTATVTGNTIFSRARTVVAVGHSGAVPPAHTWDGNAYFDDTPPWAGDGRRYSFQAAQGDRIWSGVGRSNLAGWRETTGYDANSTHTVGRPTGTKVIVRPNRHEPGRAHIAVYNWDLAATVPADVSSAGLAIGQKYELLDVQNYFGPPVLTGVYDGKPIALPMALTTVARAIGMTWEPPHTSPEFNVFVLRPLPGRPPSTGQTVRVEFTFGPDGKVTGAKLVPAEPIQ